MHNISVSQSAKRVVNRFGAKGLLSLIRYIVLLIALISITFITDHFETDSAYSASLQQLNNPLFDQTPAWQSSSAVVSSSLAWGDVDNDGDLDLAVGGQYTPDGIYPNALYINQNGTLSISSTWTVSEFDIYSLSSTVAWGDMNGDGYLDLAIGNDGKPSRVYTNTNGSLSTSPAWISLDSWNTEDVAWGDIDGDNDLDLAVSGRQIVIFQNNNGTLSTAPYWQSNINERVNSIAWGDVNGDGRLDLAAGNYGAPSKIYFNTGTTLANTPGWSVTGLRGYYATKIALSDMNRDGSLDVVIADNTNIGSSSSQGYISVFYNFNNVINTIPDYSFGMKQATLAIAPVDGDQNLDTFVGWNGAVLVTRMDNLGSSSETYIADPSGVGAVAWGDVDNDGDLDLVKSAGSEFRAPLKLYLNAGDFFNRSETIEIPNNSGLSQQTELGDVNGDGYLDLVAVSGDQPVKLYLNTNGTLQTNAVWTGSQAEPVSDLALADINSDTRLDLTIVGANRTARVYLNQNGSFQTTPSWVSPIGGANNKVAWGDINGDGYPELAVGDDPGLTRLYANNAGSIASTPLWSYPKNDYVRQLAWADIDSDGDIDLLVGSQKLQTTQNGIMVFRNNNGTLALDPIGVYSDSNSDPYLAAGDVDGDGDLDIAASDGSTTRLLPNSSGEFGLPPIWNALVAPGEDLTWHDADNDGDLDLYAVSAHNQTTNIYRNWNGNLLSTTLPIATNCYLETSIGDVNGDGLGDAICGSPGSNIRIWYSPTPLDFVYAQPVAISIRPINMADLYGSQIIRQGIIPVTYDLYHPAGKPLRNVKVYYSLSGSFPPDRSQWKIAKAAPGTQLTNLSTSPYPFRTAASEHIFYWDIAGSGVVGQYNDAVIRIEVPTNPTDISTSHQRAFVAAQSYPMRVRGSQVRTVLGNSPIANANVYRLPENQIREAKPITDSMGHNYVTDPQGYLQGRNNFAIGDRLFGLLPVSSTDVYSMYYMSAAPTVVGLQPYTVTAPGVHTLTVSSINKLLLFNLVVSLEWDARGDPDFIAQLENDIRRTSQILFDLSNGQAALGDVAIYHDKGNWGSADIVIAASNHQRPSAILGGVVTSAISDIVSSTLTIPDAYVPGQVRMGATWNRFGNPSGTLGEDWSRTLAHELGHYLFFLSDNYVGVTPNRKAIQLVDCSGSVMTDPYDDHDSEWLGRANWAGDCLNTLAEQYLGRADWQTVKHFYPMLNDAADNSGPNQLPLAVTHISIFEPPTFNTTLAAPIFPLVDNNNATVVIPDGRGQGYLLKRQNDDDSTNDYLIASVTN